MPVCVHDSLILKEDTRPFSEWEIFLMQLHWEINVVKIDLYSPILIIFHYQILQNRPGIVCVILRQLPLPINVYGL